MKTILVIKAGYDFSHGENFISIPYMCDREKMIYFIKAVFGQDAFRHYRFISATKKMLRIYGIDGILAVTK